uniref:Uncharacterized protein n=1 Tax=Setaria viridis TaxID=4556 RepID=A0A4U6T4W8_SETVI|nr:hypothetical protein SEVIR_9G448550v2 [Setaria viridis]
MGKEEKSMKNTARSASAFVVHWCLSGKYRSIGVPYARICKYPRIIFSVNIDASGLEKRRAFFNGKKQITLNADQEFFTSTSNGIWQCSI